MGRINWVQFIIAAVLGAVFGQRFAHLHPVGTVKSANGG